MFSDLTKRHLRRRLVLEFNPYQVLAAEISRPHRGKIMVDAAVEFDRYDTEGLNQWIEEREGVTTICGLVPRRAIVQRESLQPRRLKDPEYLASVVEEQQKGRFLTSTPFKVLDSTAWALRAINAIDGTPLAPDGAPQPALICGMANDEVQNVQHRLSEAGLSLDRIEAGLPSLFGAIYSAMERRGDVRGVAVIVIHEVATTVYILGKDGVHAPNPVFHGFASIIELARKQLDLKEDADVRTHMDAAHPTLVAHADKLVRRIGRDLKPVVDSYEMTTGQPVDEVFCAYLPSKLAWMEEPLARATGRARMEVNCDEWLPTAGLEARPDGPKLGPHWLGALSLVANLPETAGAKAKGPGGEDPSYHRPWHVDYRLVMASAERKAAGRRMITAVVAGALAAFAVFITVWQLYATNSLRTDLRFWEQQMVDNRKLFDELTAANAELRTRSTSLQRVYQLMGARYQPSDFFLNLGRTIPAHMRVDRIETTDTRIAISGSLLEPAEEATATLRRYMDELRGNAGIGPLFSSIKITSLQRKPTGDAVLFEITLLLNPSLP